MARCVQDDGGAAGIRTGRDRHREAALVTGALLELLPVDAIPDVARTVANVTPDLAVTASAGKRGQP